MIQTGQMKKIWATINKMKIYYYLYPLILALLMSCSNVEKTPMNKVDDKYYANFSLPNLQDEIINSDDYLDSYVLVNFWATWCAPCVKEIPSLNNLQKIFKDNENFKMIAINIGQNKDVVNKFLSDKSLSIDFAVLLDEQIELSDWNVQAIPTTFLVDKSGKVIYKIEGEKEWDSSEFTSFFRSIIN